MARTLTVRKMFDAHVHWRDGVMRNLVVPYTGRQCYAALWMPNLSPPIVTWQNAALYQKTNSALLPTGFIQVGTLYMTEDMDPSNVVEGFRRGVIKAVKFYPRSAQHGAGTTGAHAGVTDLRKCTTLLEVMEKEGVSLALHGERIDDPCNGAEVDQYDREARFIEHDLRWLRESFPGLRVTLEHITTQESVEYMQSEGNPDRLCATVTLQHLDLDRRDFFRGGVNPALHCLPVIKREHHRIALLELVTRGLPYVMAGTDSAPHPKSAKERCCGCAAGIFTAHCAIEGYAEVFDQFHALEHLDGFLSLNAARYYGIPPSEETLTLHEETWSPEGLVSDSENMIFPYGSHDDPKQRRTFKWRLQI